ncbi:uncharacterized protein LOC26529337 [Drosophila willistoni]|uniref:uncharacterized protein LOC26529337 n=1 Tax=Drosophila willistoni TaxID=7260 RepID=UPI000C26CEED|nr:uncharacterized protein LOC26529337 [Drosophila willistoni]
MRHHLLLGLCLGIFMHANLANGSIFGLFGKNDVIDPSCNCSRIKIDGSLQLNQFLQGFLVKLAQTYNQLVHGIRPQIGSEQIEGNAPRYGYELIFRILNPKNKEEQHLPSYEIPPQTVTFETIPTIETTTETVAPIPLPENKPYDIFIIIMDKYFSEQPGNITSDIVKYLIAKIVELNNFLNGLFKIEMRVILNKNLTLNYDHVKSNITISIEDIQKYPNNGVIDLPDLSPIPRPPESYVIITTLIQNYLSTQAAGNASIERIILALKQVVSILERFNRSLRHLLKLEINFVFGDNAKKTPPSESTVVLVINQPDLPKFNNLEVIGLPSKPEDYDPLVQISPLLIVSIQEFILSQIGNVDITNKFIAGVQSIISKVTYLNLLIEDWIKINISIKMNRIGERNYNTTTEYVVIPIGAKPNIAGKDKFPLLFANIQDIITKVTKLNEILKGVFTINVNFKSIEFKQPKVTQIIIFESEKSPNGGTQIQVPPRPPQHLSIIIFRVIRHYLQISGSLKQRQDPVLIIKYVISIISRLNQLLKSWLKIDLQIIFPGHGGSSYIYKNFIVLPNEIVSSEPPPISGDLPQIHPIISSLLLKYLITQSPNINSIEVIIKLIQNVLLRVVEINKSVDNLLKLDLKFQFPQKSNQNDYTKIIIINREPETSQQTSLNQFNILLWINNYLTSINRAQSQTYVQNGKKIVFLPKGTSLVLPYLYVMSGSKQVYTHLPAEIKNLYGGGFDLSNKLFRELTSKLKMDITGRIKVNVNVDVQKLFTPGDLVSALLRQGISITNVASKPGSNLFGVIVSSRPTRGVRLHVQVNHTGISNPNDLLSLLPAGLNQRSIEDKPIKLSAHDGQHLLDKITQLGHHVFKTLEKDSNRESQQLAKSIHGAIHSSPH